jgi:hypothetical protein
MEFAILGHLEIRADGEVVTLWGAHQCALLAALLAHANQPVSTERLVMVLCVEDAPRESANKLQAHISRLAQGAARPGPDRDDARGATSSGSIPTRSTPRALNAAIDEALGLWRGAPDSAFPSAEIVRWGTVPTRESRSPVARH